MISIKRLAIFLAIFALGNCKDYDDNKTNYLLVPIRVVREPSDTIEFQFNKKSLQIEPISLQAKGVNFQIAEENDEVKKFRSTAPLQQEHSRIIDITVKFREPKRKEINEQTFRHQFKESHDEVITVQIALPRNITPVEISGEIEDVIVPTEPSTTKQPRFNKALDDDFDDSVECENKAYDNKLLETALRLSDIGTHLLLKGFEAADVNPVDAIREVIAEKLELLHLEYNILQAKFIDEGLLFEMQSPKDLIEILSKQDTTDLAGLVIETTKRRIFDTGPLFDVRMGN